MTQRELPIRLTVAQQLAAARARCFLCTHFSALVPLATCIARQLDPDAPRLAHCRSRQCTQGKQVLLRAGLIESAPCECCGGLGKVVRLASKARR